MGIPSPKGPGDSCQGAGGIAIFVLFPVLPFLVFFFLKKARKPPKKQGFFIPAEPLKSLEKKGKNAQKKNKEFLEKEGIKDRNSKTTKEGQGFVPEK